MILTISSADNYLPVKSLNDSNKTKGLFRVIMYLEDNGPSSEKIRKET